MLLLCGGGQRVVRLQNIYLLLQLIKLGLGWNLGALSTSALVVCNNEFLLLDDLPEIVVDIGLLKLLVDIRVFWKDLIGIPADDSVLKQ